MFGFTCNAATADDYAPIFYFEGEETCFPVDAEYHIENSVLESSVIGGETIEYYDNILGTRNDGGVVANYQSQEAFRGYTIYYYEYVHKNLHLKFL